MTRLTSSVLHSGAKRLCVLLCALAFAVPSLIDAQVVTTDDTAGTGAATITTQSTGAGSGFMGHLGAIPAGPGGTTPIELGVDSDILGNVVFEMHDANCMGANDVAVVYIDSVPGAGVTSTTGLMGNATLHQAAVAGVGMSSGISNMSFPTGFEPDFAIAFQNPAGGGSATLYSLAAGGPTVVMPTVSLAVVSTGCGLTERMLLSGLAMTNLGLGMGGAFSWMATLINADLAFRSNEFHGTVAPAVNIGTLGMLVYAVPPGRLNRFVSVRGPIVINEVDSDQSGADNGEFVEILGPPGLRLDGLSLVLYNGSNDTRYLNLDLTGTFPMNGFFVVGDSGVSPDLLLTGSIQNGADAASLFVGDSPVILPPGPMGGPVPSLGSPLVDALVYDRGQSDDDVLLGALTPGQPQQNEISAGVQNSNSRCPDGGLPRITTSYLQVAPTPGAANDCPVAAVCGNGMLEAGEDCDDGGSNGTATSCCAMDCSFRALGQTCAASLGGCDAPNTCDGEGTCDVNVASAATECRATTGLCDTAEFCDGSTPTCPANTLTAAAVVCRPASATCDQAEACTGSSAACPPDAFFAAGTECRATSDSCDLAEVCSGVSGACPADVNAAAGTTCRAASADCDVAETCDGSASCPADGFTSAGTVCRAASDMCDVAETCTGSARICPSDAFVSAGTTCRPVNGICDTLETCTGSAAACPADSFTAAGTECNVSNGVCDPAETCTGTSNACPANMFLADGTSCADGIICDGTEICGAGACVDGTALSCDDGNLCTADMCAEPGGCDNAAVADCCNVDDDCDDSDICTADSCDGPGGTCTSDAITDCCIDDDDCDDANMCTGDACNLDTNRCERTPIAGCCTVNGDCSDSNACTADTCDVASGECTNAAIDGCCLGAGDCDDSNTCTADTCSDAMMCVNDMMAGCCLSADDCDDMDPCTTDTCDGTAACAHEMIAGCGDMDAGVSDAGMGDAGMDAGASDAGSDAGVGDGGMDAATGDSGAVDSGAEDGGDDNGGVGGGSCGCKLAGDSSGSPNPAWLLGFVALVLVRRRQR